MVDLTKSTKPKSAKVINRNWHLIDVNKQIVGRAVTKIAYLLQGKNKVDYVPYLDMGDYVVVINAKKSCFTGNKLQQKIYSNYSGYPGGLKQISAQRLFDKNPTEIIRRAVSGMLPKNKLRDRRLARLYIFPDEKHPYEENLKINPKKS